MTNQIRQNIGTHGTSDSKNLPIVVPTIFVVDVIHGLKHIFVCIRAIKLGCRYFTAGETSVIDDYDIISFGCALLHKIPYINGLRCARSSIQEQRK